jgi:hypothetical protein
MATAALSTVGGPITRAEVLQRAQFWVDQDVTYTQQHEAPDPQGKPYRRDCSGLVSMAWHLHVSRNTMQFRAGKDNVKLPSLHDLRPGDAVLKEGHIELFARWKDPSDHTDGAYVYSFNVEGHPVKNPNSPGKRGFNT